MKVMTTFKTCFVALSMMVMSGEALAGPSLELPQRPAEALTGSEFLQVLGRSPVGQRESLIMGEILKGNVPSSMRQLKEVNVGNIDGVAVSIFVLPDYLAVGTDADFVRVPMGLATAMKIASKLNATLPTRKMVDDIYAAAETKLAPQPLPPSRAMAGMEYLGRHESTISDQLDGRSWRGLVAGHKKDLVLTPRLLQKKGKVAIYGWHRLGGRAIQPLSTVHGAAYYDYSHGVRLVSNQVLVGGVLQNMAVIDAAVSKALSDEAEMPTFWSIYASLGYMAASN